MSETPTTPEDQRALVTRLIKRFRIAMLTTRDAQGRLKARPLGIREVEFDGDLWFATRYSTDKVREILADPQVNVSLQDDGGNTHVSLTGHATIVRDRATIDALWSPAMGLFLPGGKDDPDVCLIKVGVEGAEYWDAPGSLVGKLAYLATVAIKRDPEALARHDTVDLGGEGR